MLDTDGMAISIVA